MTSGQKVAASLLATVVAFVVFIVFVFSGFFSAIETRFYEPAKINDIRKQLDAAADASEIYIENILDKFARGQDSYLNEASVKSYIDSAPSDENVQERTKVTGKLFADMQGLSGIRIVESNGRNVHFSTYSEDILRQTEMMRMYRDYADLRTPTGTEEIAFEKISAPDNRTAAENYKLTFDGKNNRIIFSLPFYDNYSVYRGTILFYVNSFDFNRALNSQNVAPLQDTCSLVTSDDEEYSGFVFGLPSVGNEILQQEIVRSWRSGSLGPDKIVNINTHGEASDENSNYWLVLTSSKVPYLYLAGVYRDSEFAMLPAVRVLLLVCVLITMFLVVFMIFSIKQDDMVVIRDRIKRFQSAIINEYLDNREKVDWAEMSRQIAGRKYEAAAQIKKNLGKRAEKHEAETNALIDKSWNEILAAIGSGGSAASSTNADEIKKMLEDIISKGGIKVNAAPVSEQSNFVTEYPQEEADTEELLEDVPEELGDDVEDIESLEDAEPLDEADTEELLEDVPEELEEDVPEELGDDVEDIESLEEAEPLDEADTEELLEDVPEELEEDVPEELGNDVEDIESLEEAEPIEETTGTEELLEDVPEELEEDIEEEIEDDVEDLDYENIELVDVFEEAEPLEEIGAIELLEDVPQELEDDLEEISYGDMEVVDVFEDVEAFDDIGTEDAPEELEEKANERSDDIENIENIEDINVTGDAEPLEDISLQTFDFLSEPSKTDSAPEHIGLLQKATMGLSATNLQAQHKPEKESSSGLLRKMSLLNAAKIDDDKTDEKNAHGDSDEPLLFTITPSAPDFSRLDRDAFASDNHKDDYEDAAVDEKINGEVYEVEPLKNDAMTVDLSRFDIGSASVNGELSPYMEDVIVQDENGVFKISGNLIYDEDKQDKSFKELVDSVLK